MTALSWALRLIIFSILLVFALNNTEPVSLNFVLVESWQAPLVVVLLIFFAGGAVLGVLSVLGVIFRQRMEIARLKRVAGKASETSTLELPPAP